MPGNPWSIPWDEPFAALVRGSDSMGPCDPSRDRDPAGFLCLIHPCRASAEPGPLLALPRGSKLGSLPRLGFAQFGVCPPSTAPRWAKAPQHPSSQGRPQPRARGRGCPAGTAQPHGPCPCPGHSPGAAGRVSAPLQRGGADVTRPSAGTALPTDVPSPEPLGPCAADAGGHRHPRGGKTPNWRK